MYCCHTTAWLRGGPQKTGEGNALKCSNCKQYSLLFTVWGEESGLSHEYTLITVTEGSTIKYQRKGRLQKRQVGGTIEMSIVCTYLCLTLEYCECANIHVSVRSFHRKGGTQSPKIHPVSSSCLLSPVVLTQRVMSDVAIVSGIRAVHGLYSMGILSSTVI